MKNIFTICFWAAMMAAPMAKAQRPVWPADKANAWYADKGWLRGCDFIPSTAINQLEMWQEATFDPATIDRELSYAQSIGLNCMRVFLHHVAWQVDPSGFKQRMDKYLSIAEEHHIVTLFVFFDDCWNPTYHAGTQPAPRTGIHNSGWLRDPGKLYYDEPALVDTLETYVKDILTTFGHDKRILLWDLYNEPGNSDYGDKSLPLLAKVFDWGHEVNPDQPLSAGVWSDRLTTLNTFQLSHSDVITYHNYEPPAGHQHCIDTLKPYGRPLICTEYMARLRGSTFFNIMPLLKDNNIAAINWGLVSGKTNTKYAWDTPMPDGKEPKVWFHDIFRPDGTPYDPKETAFIRKLTSGAGAQEVSDTIPLAGNAWSNPNGGVDAWIRVTKTGKLHVWVKDSSYDAGMVEVTDTGYQCIHLKGIRLSKQSIIVQGEPLNGREAFVPNDEGNFFYWGRRGPSVHLRYKVPAGEQAEWFYNEVTVPKGQDIQGSYFMACGFGQGYFGMQVNSPTERHILFSVWSPFETDNPASVPDSLRIRVLRKGEGVHAQAFGNEGSGGQSYLNYMWQAGHTYRFLVHARPGADRHTVFTAWFYAPEEGRWRLLASFGRPQTQSWLTGLHSFLENFDPDQGIYQRYVLFNHQWIRDTTGRWIGLNRAVFTTDNTGRKGYRMDYAGGVRDTAFYLENCGHFSTYTPAGTWFERPADPPGRQPDIDLTTLP